MSRGYWLSLIAVVGWLTTSQALAVPPKAERHSNATSEQNSQTSPAVEQVSAPIVSHPSTEALLQKMVDEVTKANARATNDKHDENDLVAQESMATSTYWIMWFTGVQIILTLFGTFLIWKSLALNRAAVSAANSANAHALEANAQQRVSNETELRAYITVIPDGINLLRKSAKVIGHVIVKNVGHVIAQETQVYVCMELEKTEGKERRNFLIPQTSGRPLGSLPPTGELQIGSPEHIRVSDMELVKPPDKGPTEGQYIYVWGRVDYKHGFEGAYENRHTRFCFRYDLESHDRVRQGIEIDKKYARYHEYGSEAN